MNQRDTSVHQYWAKTIETESPNLTGWEKEFFTAIQLKLSLHIALTDKQEGALEKLYEKVTI